MENSLVVAKGEGWSGKLGSADASYYIYRMDKHRSYCTTQGTIFNIL